MKHILTATIITLALTGCQSTSSTYNTTYKPTSPKVLSSVMQNKIGTTYNVMILDVYQEIRDSLYDGMPVTVSDIRLSQYGNPQILITDAQGKQIFEKWYAFSDLGLWDQDIRPVQVSIDQNKVNQPLGRVEHGFGNPTFNQTYGHESVVTQSKIDGVVAYGHEQSIIKGKNN